MSSGDQDLIDFAILPQTRIQNYEATIDEQKEAIEKLKAEIEKIQNSSEVKEDLPLKDDKTMIDDVEEPKIEEVKDEVEEKKEEEKPMDTSNTNPTKDLDQGNLQEAVSVQVVKPQIGKNINNECLVKQLKHKLNDTNYLKPSNIDALLAAAVSKSASKLLPNEREFYEALKSNNLISLVRNKKKFDHYIRASFFKI